MKTFLKNLFSKELSLKALMPPVRGTVLAEAPLAKRTWLGVGGNAEVLFMPSDSADLAFFLANHPDAPITVLGGASNMLIRDGGIPGVVIHLEKGFDNIEVKDNTLICGAGAKNAAVAKIAMLAGLSGLEFLAGIPGTIGGAVKMNAGAQGHCVSDILSQIKAIDTKGKNLTFQRNEIPFDYRTNALPNNLIFTKVIFQLTPENKQNIHNRMTQYKQIRENTQPQGVRTAGSMFKNPVGLAAWQLIEKAGCRGLKVGGAMVSEKHCNFFINTGKATALDFETLALSVQKRVYETSHIMLEWEVRCIGVKTKRFSSFGGK